MNSNKYNPVKFILPILLLYSSISYGQPDNLFSSAELDSLSKFFIPLCKSDSEKINEIKNFKFLNVFYLNGNCSLCLGKMKDAETFYTEHQNGNVNTLFIVETSDTMMFNFHRDKLGVKVPIVWDNKHQLKNKGISIGDHEMFLLNKFGEILLQGDFIQKKKQEYIETINEFK